MSLSQRTAKPGVYRARQIHPIASPVIHDGWLHVDNNGKVKGFGQQEPGKVDEPTIDLGDSWVIPALVNAHTHLDLSDCEKITESAPETFEEWLLQIIEVRNHADASAQIDSVGALSQCFEGGAALVGDIDGGSESWQVRREHPIESLISFPEILGLQKERSAPFFERANSFANNAPRSGISPHAPYSTSFQSIDAAVAWSSDRQRPLQIHLAESPSERQLLQSGTGPLSGLLTNLGLELSDHFPYSSPSPFIELIERLSNCHRGCLVHCNDLNDDEISRLAKFNNLSVVYCPRTHAFFGFDRHPVRKMLDAGIKVALGTDSLASNPDLHLWNEVQYLLSNRKDLSETEILKMATVNGAEALGDQIHGRIQINKPAKLLVVHPSQTGLLDATFEWL